jgi:hypothetical protein
MISSLKAGTDSLTAKYDGDNTYSAVTSAATKLTVGKSASSIALVASPNTAFVGQQTTFTATVTPPAGRPVPTGSVAFVQGTKTLATVGLNSSGAAVWKTSLAAGTYSIVANYEGSASLAASDSSAVKVVVNPKIATTTKLVVSAQSVVAGKAVTFTATVKPATGKLIPTGTVRFQDQSGTFGTATLNGSGVASLAVTTLPVGTHSVEATYEGDAGDSQSESAAVIVKVTKQ